LTAVAGAGGLPSGRKMALVSAAATNLLSVFLLRLTGYLAGAKESAKNEKIYTFITKY